MTLSLNEVLSSLDPRSLIRGAPVPERSTIGAGESVNPRSRESHGHFQAASRAEVSDAAGAAREAFLEARRLPDCAARMAELLETVAQRVEASADAILLAYHAESALPIDPRGKGELQRTVGQLRFQAKLCNSSRLVNATISTATGAAAYDIRKRTIGVGPVAVWAPSNFPLAFSVAGGDTAAAFAAGCPVVMKANGNHQATSALVGRIVCDAVKQVGLPSGWFAMLYGSHNVGLDLIGNRRIMAGAYTGSRKGGLALAEVAHRRGIPFYAEMSSVNPVILLPGQLAQNPETCAEGYLSSLTMGRGQFCTNPGVCFAVRGPALDAFLERIKRAAHDGDPALGMVPGTMLSRIICLSYFYGISRLEKIPGIELVAESSQQPDQDKAECGTRVYRLSGEQFLQSLDGAQEEVFGAAGLIVVVDREVEMLQMIDALEGQLTATVHATPAELASDLGRELISRLELLAGRVVVNGWPTGVAVCNAMVHGGPYPATTTGHTSVGESAGRFRREVCYQGFPDEALPPELQAANPMALQRSVNGTLQTA